MGIKTPPRGICIVYALGVAFLCSASAHAREPLSGKYEVDSPPNLPLAFLANIRYNNICAKNKRRSDNVSDNDT